MPTRVSNRLGAGCHRFESCHPDCKTSQSSTEMLAGKVQMLEQIARDSVASGRENNAIGAIRLLAELTGFGADIKN